LIEANVHLRRVGLAGLMEARPVGVPVLDTWDAVRDVAEGLGLADELKLFARPSVTRENGAIAGEVVWYGPAGGVISPFRQLDPAKCETAEAELGRGLERLRPLFHDAGAGPLFAAWLNIPSVSDDVLLVNNQPVITNWGLLPAAVAASAAARRQHFQREIGRIVPQLTTTPPFGGDEFRANLAAAAEDGPTAGPPTAESTGSKTDQPTPSAVGGVPPEPAASTAISRPWLPVAIATAIAALILLILLIPGVLIYPNALTAERRSVDPDLIAQTRETLERRLKDLQARLREPLCLPGSSTTAPGAAVPGTLSPQPDNRPNQPTTPPTNRSVTQPIVPPSPTSLAGPRSNGNRPGNLIAHLDAVTALIIAPRAGGSGASFGTGFFVNDHQLVTNQHVIANADPARVLVVNKSKRRAVQGRVAANTRTSDIGGEDFAVIEVQAEQGRAFMTLTNRVERGDLVIAAGYPTFVMRNDIGFQRLLEESDLSAIPDPAVTQGWVTALQTSERRTPILVHGATISKGNSGGPLADMCGRAVGINTYGDVDHETALRLNFALRTEGLRRFLDAQRITYTGDDAACEPAAAAPPTEAARREAPNPPAPAASARDQPAPPPAAPPTR